MTTTPVTLRRCSPQKPLVILVYPKIDHEKDYVYFWMPFSVLTVARALISEGVDVVIFDGNLSIGEAEWGEFLDQYLDAALCIGVSIMTGGNQIAHALRMVSVAKERDHCPPVVFGGPHVNVLADQTLAHPLVDVVLTGPGQDSMPRYVAMLLSESALESVPGLVAKQRGAIIRGPQNPPRTGVLGGYPWHLVPVERYIRSDPTVAERTLNYVSSQGCIYNCRFCYELTYRKKWSSMAVPELFLEIEFLTKAYDLSGVKFYDADFFINLRRAREFAEALASSSLELAWAASINPNDVRKARKNEPDLLKSIAASGCSRLLMGVESGSDRVLSEIVRKDITRDVVLSVAEEIARNGIMGSYTFIVGFPGETEDEVEDTYSLITELRDLDPQPETRVHLFAPYPGTPLFDVAVAYGFEPPTDLEAWSRYDYYDSQTPWTSETTVRRARANTNMVLSPEALAMRTDPSQPRSD